MDWLTQYWPYLIAAGLLVVLVARVAIVLLPKYRQPVRHSGERTIRVIGVGGAGGNTVNHMIRAKQRGVDYIAVNTDAQVLDDSLAARRVQIGEQLTQGLGAGGDAAIGRQAAEEDAEEISRLVAGSDLVFIAAGLGGGTGSGAAPVIAAEARKVGALTVGVVTRPFAFEGLGRRRIADAAEAELRANVDTLLLIENERVLSIVGEDTSMLDAFTAVNEVLASIVRAVVDIMTVPGLINLDFADVRAIMQDGGMATAGIGAAVGPDRAVAAAQAAVTNPLLNHDLAGAGAILLNVAGASGMTMHEVKRAAEVVHSAADPEAMIIFGTIFDDHLDDELRVTVIATRLSDDFAYVHRVASDTTSIAATDEPAPAAAVAVAAASAVTEEESEEDAPRWAAIPIVTSEDELVPVVASGATATAELDNVPEPFAPWAPSQAYVARVEDAPAEEPAAPADASWIAPTVGAEVPEPEPEPAAPESEPWVAANVLAATVFAQSEPDQTVSELEPAEEPAPVEQSWSPTVEAETAEPETGPAEQSGAAVSEAEAPEPATAGQPWFAATDEPAEPATAGQPWFAATDEAEAPEFETAPTEQSWSAQGEAVAPEDEPWASVTAQPEADEASEPEPLEAFAEASPSETLDDEPESAPSTATAAFLIGDEPAPVAELAPAEPMRPAEPPWYDPGDEALEAARSAAAPAFVAPDEPAPETAPSPPPGYPAPPGKVVVSEKARPGAPEPPPSQLARRTTQAVLTGVWKRLQKPPESRR